MTVMHSMRMRLALLLQRHSSLSALSQTFRPARRQALALAHHSLNDLTVFNAGDGVPPANYATLVDRFGLSGKEHPNPEPKMAQRDSYQRKAYAVRRMSLAVMRLGRATSAAEKEMASCWVKAWGRVSGIRQFKLGNDGGNGKGGNRR